MTVDPLRDPRRLAEIEHAEAQPSHEVGCSWGVGQRCTCKAIRAERGEVTAGVPEEGPAEHVANALMLLGESRYSEFIEWETVAAVIRRLQVALRQLRGSPLRAPQKDDSR